MDIASFDDLLQAAGLQPEPQRLLFVFAGATLPDDATPAQRAEFAAGRGGALEPLMCVDKVPQELTGFQALVDEAAQMGPDWRVVFVAALSGRGGRAPTSAEADAPLQQMVESIRRGALQSYLPFDRSGQPLRLGR